MSVLVNKETAQALNMGREVCVDNTRLCRLFHLMYLLQSLSDILVLRIENFNDFYINLSCGYARSCFGMHLEELVTATAAVPVRSTPLPALGQLPGMTEAQQQTNNSISSTASQAAVARGLGVPKELWRLIDALWGGRAMREKDLFEFEATGCGDGAGGGASTAVSGSETARAVQSSSDGPEVQSLFSLFLFEF